MGSVPRISWGAWGTDDQHGYGHVASRFPQALRLAGLDVYDPYNPDWDLLAVISPPCSWFSYRGKVAHHVVMHTMYEARPLPPHWVENLNTAGLIWTPSQWAADLFADCGVTRPMMVAGYGLDPCMIAPHDRSGRNHPLTVAVWGDALFTRKRVWDAIQVFLRAKLPDARLSVKLSSIVGRGMLGNVADLGLGNADVTIIADRWSELQLLEWLHQADVGIYLSGGEGYGLMPLQMMASGLPLICADNTGMREYLTPETALLVPCAWGPAPPGAYEYSAEHMVPDLDVAVERLRWVAANRDAAAAIGMRAANHAATFTWRQAGLRAAAGLRSYWRKRHEVFA